MVVKYDRYAKEYIEGVQYVLLSILETIDDESPHKEEQRKTHFDPYSFYDMDLDYDTWANILLSEIREGKKTHITCPQIKGIIRLKHMISRFDDIIAEVVFPTDLEGMQKMMIEMPYWKKMSRQAHLTLEMLRK